MTSPSPAPRSVILVSFEEHGVSGKMTLYAWPTVHLPEAFRLVREDFGRRRSEARITALCHREVWHVDAPADDEPVATETPALEEIAGTQQTAPEKPAPTPPPADGPGLAQAARELADAVTTWPVGPSAMQTSEGERVWRALNSLGRALAAEEERARVQALIASPAGGFYARHQKMSQDSTAEAERERIRRRALRLWRQRDPDQHVPPVVVAALDEWADAESAETSQ